MKYESKARETRGKNENEIDRNVKEEKQQMQGMDKSTRPGYRPPIVNKVQN